ncbi:MAG: DUF4190 domain-containing protein [Clostridia bacterium]|nr:DUF4190 domain-containing protein [Clostridia bacterium]
MEENNQNVVQPKIENNENVQNQNEQIPDVEEQPVVKEAEIVNNVNNGQYNQTSTNSDNSRGLAIASLVCSLVGLLIFKTALGIAGIITGILALKKIKELEDKSSKGMAIAGIVISCIDLGIGVIGFGFSIISIIINLL